MCVKQLKACKTMTIMSGSVIDWETKDSQQTICGTRDDNPSKTWFIDFKRRAALAAAGGPFLVGLMWLPWWYLLKAMPVTALEVRDFTVRLIQKV